MRTAYRENPLRAVLLSATLLLAGCASSSYSDLLESAKEAEATGNSPWLAYADLERRQPGLRSPSSPLEALDVSVREPPRPALGDRTPETGSLEWEAEKALVERRDRRLDQVLRGICKGC